MHDAAARVLPAMAGAPTPACGAPPVAGSGVQDDLAERVASLELAVGVSDLRERIRARDRDLEAAGGDEGRELGEDVRAGARGVAVRLGAVARRGVEVDDRVDALRRDAEVDGEVDVARAEGVDQGVGGPAARLTEALGEAVAVGEGRDAVVAQPR